jgi:hypothetical protein
MPQSTVELATAAPAPDGCGSDWALLRAILARAVASKERADALCAQSGPLLSWSLALGADIAKALDDARAMRDELRAWLITIVERLRRTGVSVERTRALVQSAAADAQAFADDLCRWSLEVYQAP